MCPRDSEGMADNVEPDQTASHTALSGAEQPDLGLQCLLEPICPKTSDFYSNW